MKLKHRIIDILWPPGSPPRGGFVDDLPEAFGALDEHGEVFIIGYKGEWFTIAKPSPWIRLHNWIVHHV